MFSWGGDKKATRSAGTTILRSSEHSECSFDSLVSRARMTPTTAEILRKRLKFDALLPMQALCYAGIQKGRDVILHSRTGTGKTLAYALPIMERFLLEREHESAGRTEEPPAPKETRESNLPQLVSGSLKQRAGPFCIIALFSNELAVQTQSVINGIYAKRGIHTLVAGFDSIPEGAPGAPCCDVLIGTIAALDTLIRGRSNRNTTDHESRKVGKKTKREEDNKDKDGGGGDAGSDEDEDETGLEVQTSGTVDASCISCVVIDEVDTTLGPKFSRVGRRMKLLLKHVRKANGSLSRGLTHDFRSHHYVLVGATVPNWVQKCGFMGTKKYLYELVDSGSSKLPETLECFSLACDRSSRLKTVCDYLCSKPRGRVIVFVSHTMMANLETMLRERCQETKKGAAIIIRALSSEKDEVERIKCIEEFNSGTANTLLCTDVGARGLDFVHVDVVVMTTVPSHRMASEVFIHRAGRTARIGKIGSCVVIYDPTTDAESLRALEAVVHVQFKAFTDMDSASQSCRFSLTVRKAFRGGKAESVALPTPQEVLQQNLGADLFGKLSQVAPVNDTTVEFTCGASDKHNVATKLWKYDLREVVTAA